MRIPYLSGKAKVPQPSLHGGTVRHRPITAVRISGPGGTWLLDGLLDTGSDDTIFPEWVAGIIGLDLHLATEQEIRLAGRAKPIRCRYLSAQFRITDGKQETYEWDGVVGFVAVPMKLPLLGQAGCLQYFDVSFLGADHVAILIPNHSFQGKRI